MPSQILSKLMNNSSNKTKRLVLLISGVTDALLGAFFLLVGLGWLPIDIGVQGWFLIVLGGIFFILGVAVAVYNLTRWEE